MQGISIQVKGRYNISTDRSQRWDTRVGAVSLSSVDKLIDYRSISYSTKGGQSGMKLWLCFSKRTFDLLNLHTLMIKRPQQKQDDFTKFRKSRIKGITQPVILKYDSVVGLYSCENTKISSGVLWSLKRVIQQTLNRKVKIHLMSFPHLGLTKKPSEVRIGKGRGSLSTFVSRVRCGDLI